MIVAFNPKVTEERFHNWIAAGVMLVMTSLFTPGIPVGLMILFGYEPLVAKNFGWILGAWFALTTFQMLAGFWCTERAYKHEEDARELLRGR